MSGLHTRTPDFKVIAFYTAKNDAAHISFVQEANRWFPAMGARHHFTYDSTADWSNLDAGFLASCLIVVKPTPINPRFQSWAQLNQLVCRTDSSVWSDKTDKSVPIRKDFCPPTIKIVG